MNNSRKDFPHRNINKDTVFRSPKGSSANEDSKSWLQSIINAEKAERDAKTARLRALRQANAKK